MAANEVSTVQYGTGQAPAACPSPVAALSGSAYRSTYAWAWASGITSNGA